MTASEEALDPGQPVRSLGNLDEGTLEGNPEHRISLRSPVPPEEIPDLMGPGPGTAHHRGYCSK
jgi:hypothetical protein